MLQEMENKALQLREQEAQLEAKIQDRKNEILELRAIQMEESNKLSDLGATRKEIMRALRMGDPTELSPATARLVTGEVN